MTNMNEFVTLYFQGGGSDKVYQASLYGTNNGGYLVDFAFGRRGTFLNQGSKTTSPLPYQKAKKIYDKLVDSKIAKGYSPGPFYNNGIKPASSPAASVAQTPPPTPTPPATPKKPHVNAASNFSGFVPQLLNVIDENRAAELLDDNNYILQEKKDGKRTVISVTDRTAKGINRKGSNIAVSQEISEEAEKCPENILMDGEDVNCKLWVFDLLQRDDEDLRNQPYSTRLRHLMEIAYFYFDGDSIEVVRTADNSADKHALFDTLRGEGAEGVVFKKKTAPYTPGRPASGGDQLKYKFYDTASVLVYAQNSQRSVSMQLFDGKSWVDVGNVTIPPNHDIPSPQTVIEVRYLYAYVGGSLYQPVYLGEREDIDKSECTTDQLKYKAQTIDA